MSFPKIRHQKLCQAVLMLLWGMSLLVVLLGVTILGTQVSGSENIGVWVMIVAACLWTVFSIVPSPIIADVLLIFQQIRNEQKVRSAYVTIQNGSDRETITETILERLRSFGYEESILPGEWAPICLRSRVATEDSTQREKKLDMNCLVAVYTMPYLSEESYRAILSDAGVRHRAARRKQTAALGTWVERMYGYRLVIILADTIANSVSSLALERSLEDSGCWVIPWVVSCSDRTYYGNLREEPGELRDFLPGSAPVWPCRDLPEKIVFGGKVPVDSAEPDWIDLDQSIWYLMRRIAQSQREEFAGMLCQGYRSWRQMKDGEVRLEKRAVLCRSGKRLAICPASLEEWHMTLTPARRWVDYAPGLGIKHLVYLTGEESDPLRHRVEACLRQQGYEVLWEGEDTV